MPLLQSEELITFTLVTDLISAVITFSSCNHLCKKFVKCVVLYQLPVDKKYFGNLVLPQLVFHHRLRYPISLTLVAIRVLKAEG